MANWNYFFKSSETRREPDPFLGEMLKQLAETSKDPALIKQVEELSAAKKILANTFKPVVNQTAENIHDTWLSRNREALAAVKQGLKQAKNGEFVNSPDISSGKKPMKITSGDDVAVRSAKDEEIVRAVISAPEPKVEAPLQAIPGFWAKNKVSGQLGVIIKKETIRTQAIFGDNGDKANTVNSQLVLVEDAWAVQLPNELVIWPEALFSVHKTKPLVYTETPRNVKKAAGLLIVTVILALASMALTVVSLVSLTKEPDFSSSAFK